MVSLIISLMLLLIGFVPDEANKTFSHPATTGDCSQRSRTNFRGAGAFAVIMLASAQSPSYLTFIGRVFGWLTVVEFVGYHTPPCGHSVSLWKCLCKCGKHTVVSRAHLRTGHTKSCGCYRFILPTTMNVKHGFARVGKHHPVYRCWRAMLLRCRNKNDPDYGGRGITVCEQWLKFENFYEDMGPTWKDGLQIERKDVNGNYEPSNCIWADRIEQANNKRNNRHITANGATHTTAEWARITGLSATLIQQRIDVLGWSPEEAINKPKRHELAWKQIEESERESERE